MSVATYTKTGAKATTTVRLDKSVFGLEVQNHELLRHAYESYLANGRDNLAVTKTRGLVRGGGRKPWKQKGTGRARFGSSRNPIWRGGGITFGPTGKENYSIKLQTKAKRLAIRQALSMAASENRIKVIETFENKDGKTASVVKLLAKLDAKRRVLVLVSAKVDGIDLDRVVSNLSEVKVSQAKYLNVYDVMNADTVVISKKSLEIISEWLGESKS